MKYLLVVQLYGNLSITTATSEINETVESMSRFLTTNRNIELLELYEGKLSRTVLRGEGGSNALDLPDVQKQGDFFVESPIILFASIIWYLKIYQNGKFCTFPHAIEFLNRRYEDIFPILTSYPELENYLSPFMDAWLGGAAEQLMGQIASAKIPLSRMISPQLYWVMSDSEFTLDINNPEEPKILCVGNNPDRQNIYGAALGLYNSRIVKLINKKGMLKSSVIIDELPTIYFKGLDNLIATARSNKVAVCLGFQDFSQLVRDYGDKGGESGDEHCRQYFLRSGGGGNSKDTLRSGSGRCCRNGSPSPSTGRMFPPPSTRRWTRSFHRVRFPGLRRECLSVLYPTTSTSVSSRRFFIARLWWMPKR